MSTPTVILGGQYRDRVSGWTGTATARYEYMNGCVRIEISSTKDGEPKSFAFDVEQIEPIAAEPIVVNRTPTGGPRDTTPPARR